MKGRCVPSLRLVRRSQAAGLDGIELHYAHAYTLASFLSATNTRTDGYGGPREARVRLPLEVFDAVRAAVSSKFAVGCRFLAEGCITVRLCRYTNYCEALDQRHREVTCELWDRDGLDQPCVVRSADGKRRLLAPDWP